MKKKVALIGAAVGVAGGLIYALESQWRHNHSANAHKDTDDQSSGAENNSDARSLDAQSSDHRGKPAASMAKVESGTSANGEAHEHVIDDQGTDQSAAAQILRSIRDRAFEASDEKLALALGRPTEEISEWTGGSGLVDGDVLMKARTLAMQRGFEV